MRLLYRAFFAFLDLALANRYSLTAPSSRTDPQIIRGEKYGEAPVRWVLLVSRHGWRWPGWTARASQHFIYYQSGSSEVTRRNLTNELMGMARI